MSSIDFKVGNSCRPTLVAVHLLTREASFFVFVVRSCSFSLVGCLLFLFVHVFLNVVDIVGLLLYVV